MENQDFLDLVDRLYEKREYRPVGVAVLYRDRQDGRDFLIIQSAKNSEIWMFPQGGIDSGESIDENLARELREELGINFDTDVSPVSRAYHYEELDAESTRKDKRGFTKGKAYVYTLMKYIGEGSFRLQEEEIADVKWLTYEQAVEHFNMGRPEKAALSRRSLDKTVNLLNRQ